MRNDPFFSSSPVIVAVSIIASREGRDDLIAKLDVSIRASREGRDHHRRSNPPQRRGFNPRVP
jgi:hypothetical protein